LLRLFNEPEEDWPEKISDRFACFRQDMKQKVTEEMGDFFRRALQTCCTNFEIDRSEYGEENPAVYQYIFEEAKRQGKASPTIEKIVLQIVSHVSC
jgi:hypothetical protein